MTTNDLPITADGLIFINKDGRIYHKDGRIGSKPDVRDLTCPVCGQGWEETAESLWDQYSMHNIPTPMHVQCWVRHSALKERCELQWALNQVRIFAELQPIPNRYWPKSYPDAGIPWYQARVDELGFRIVIGHRKRVLSITLRPQGPNFTEEMLKVLITDFAAEEVTKNFDPHEICLHAWTDDKRDEYLKMLMHRINPPKTKAK